MHACGKVLALALLGTAVATPFAVKSASFRVGITIVDACNIRTPASAPEHVRNPVQADCSGDTPYNVALGDRSMHDDDRSRPAIVPDDGAVPGSDDRKSRIATFTF